MAVTFHKLAPPPRDAPPDARFLTDRVRTARPADAPELAVNGHRSRPTQLHPPPALATASWTTPASCSLRPLARSSRQQGGTLAKKNRSRKKCCTSPFARVRPTGRCPPFRSAQGLPWSDPCDTTGWPLPPCRCSNDATPNHHQPHRVVRRDGCGSRAQAVHNWAADRITLIKHQRRQSPAGSAPRLAADPLERCRSVAARGEPQKWPLQQGSCRASSMLKPLPLLHPPTPEASKPS